MSRKIAFFLFLTLFSVSFGLISATQTKAADYVPPTCFISGLEGSPPSTPILYRGKSYGISIIGGLPSTPYLMQLSSFQLCADGSSRNSCFAVTNSDGQWTGNFQLPVTQTLPNGDYNISFVPKVEIKTVPDDLTTTALYTCSFKNGAGLSNNLVSIQTSAGTVAGASGYYVDRSSHQCLPCILGDQHCNNQSASYYTEQSACQTSLDSLNKQTANSSSSSCTGSDCSKAGGQLCGDNNSGIQTAIGCIHTDPTQLIKDLFTLATGVGGGIALLFMIFGAFGMITSAGNPESLKAGQQMFTNAIIGILFIVFSTLLLQIIGVNILSIPGFTK